MRTLRKLSYALLIVGLLAFTTVGASSCNRGSGCKITESAKPKMDRKGNFKKGKTKSGLFSKKMRKKMK